MDLNQIPFFMHYIESQLVTVPHSAKRLFHGRGRRWPGLEQLTADWLDNQLMVSIFKAPEADFLMRLQSELSAMAQRDIWLNSAGHCIALQHRYQRDHQIDVIAGQLDSCPVICEQGLKYQLDIGKNQNFGLFLDMSEGRRWVRQQAAGQRVLNLFAYTCGFSVAAIAGGAQRVVNLDMSKASLLKGRHNHLLNQHDTSAVHFLPHDVFKSWSKLRKYGPYDLIIIDPPTFQKGSFVLTQDYRKILRRLKALLHEGGTVLACVNSPTVACSFLIEMMAEEAPFLKFERRLDNPPEFEDIDPQAGLKALVFR